jgi:hypothetical protein
LRARATPPAALLLCTALLAGACQLVERQHYAVELRPDGVTFVHLFQRPTFAVVLLREVTCRGDMGCVVAHLRALVTIDGAAGDLWARALDRPDQLHTAISVAQHGYDPQTGSLPCLSIYATGSLVGWGNRSGDEWCRSG